MKRGLLALLILGTACATPIARTHRGYVERALFTTAVENHEPQDKVTVLPNDHRKIYYFSELRGMAGQTVTHRWKYDGKVMAKVRFKIGGGALARPVEQAARASYAGNVERLRCRCLRSHPVFEHVLLCTSSQAQA